MVVGIVDAVLTAASAAARADDEVPAADADAVPAGAELELAGELELADELQAASASSAAARPTPASPRPVLLLLLLLVDRM
jgi:hypothetical protein